MSNLTPATIALTGVGGAACSYYISPKRDNKGISAIVNVVFRDKYRKALLDPEKDKSLWQEKWLAMKKEKPTHELLKKSIEKASYIDEAQKLHGEGCHDIYSSAIIATPYFLDFRNYCSKSNKDVLGTGWITTDIKAKAKGKPSNEWDTKLKSLQGSNKKDLVTGLISLYSKIEKTKAPNHFSEEHRKELKDWCDSIGEEIYSGHERSDFESVKKFCTNN
ncbi:hypothetical protein HF1_09960 [Mycoplasma haemofelis str. Langford 1]|uniref:Uncharacterized protein n=1 Tax=Mycoplasma haemofelis (strain Langford 1) TaxID=941640 RepID=E8ZIN3_MYCHL|nr:hypothetical protein [Mycoplasma haemofelis]CBY93004.1 hypothetical protein HF1_09960 [Mycoplasma haemofelis str. Langford 1]